MAVTAQGTPGGVPVGSGSSQQTQNVGELR